MLNVPLSVVRANFRTLLSLSRVTTTRMWKLMPGGMFGQVSLPLTEPSVAASAAGSEAAPAVEGAAPLSASHRRAASTSGRPGRPLATTQRNSSAAASRRSSWLSTEPRPKCSSMLSGSSLSASRYFFSAAR